MELVKINQNKVFADSRVIADTFGKQHKHILEIIDKLILSIENSNSSFSTLMFSEKKFTNSINREYRYYELNRDGFSLLVMGLNGKKALEWKLKYIQAFNIMEKTLLNKSNEEWITTREQGKLIRRNETDTIQEFTDYAISQGSKSAQFYYKHYTNATYKALQLLENKKPKTRETLDLLQLHQLLLAEDIVTKTIKREMENKEHYKVIFEKCKISLENFANSLMITK